MTSEDQSNEASTGTNEEPEEVTEEEHEHQDRPDEQPPFHLNRDGRPSGTPIPPGAETVDTETVTSPKSKRVMLRAERHDEVEISLVVSGMTKVPQRFTVVKRTETYFGPKLLLDPVDVDSSNWMLTCPGPNTQLILWKYITGTEDKWHAGRVPVSEVRARISDFESYEMCSVCGEPLKSMWHERLSVAGVCDTEEVNDVR